MHQPRSGIVICGAGKGDKQGGGETCMVVHLDSAACWLLALRDGVRADVSISSNEAESLLKKPFEGPQIRDEKASLRHHDSCLKLRVMEVERSFPRGSFYFGMGGADRRLYVPSTTCQVHFWQRTVIRVGHSRSLDPAYHSCS